MVMSYPSWNSLLSEPSFTTSRKLLKRIKRIIKPSEILLMGCHWNKRGEKKEDNILFWSKSLKEEEEEEEEEWEFMKCGVQFGGKETSD